MENNKMFDNVVALAIAAFMAFLAMSGSNIEFYIIGIGIFIIWKLSIGKNFKVGFTTKNLFLDLKDYGWSALLIVVFVILGFCLGLYPFDKKAEAYIVCYKILVDYILIAVLEELFLRGLIQNIMEKSLFGYKKKEACVRAMLVTSILFGIGKAATIMEERPIIVMAVFVWSVALSLYYGGIYAKTGNLLVPIICHILLNFGELPLMFSSKTEYPMVSLCICMALYIVLGAHGLLVAGMKKNMD